MAEQTITWKGQAVTARLRQAQKLGLNAVMGECVVHAKQNHPWQNQTGILEGSINIVDYAADTDTGTVGRWGSQDVVYALIHELGGTIEPKNAKALAIPQPDGSVRFVQRVTIPARPYLRPAADATYPQLPAKIRAAYQKLGGASGASQGPTRDA